MNYFFERQKQVNYIPFIPNNIQNTKETTFNAQVQNPLNSSDQSKCNYPNIQNQKNSKLLAKGEFNKSTSNLPNYNFNGITTQIINFNQSIPNPNQSNINFNQLCNKHNNRFEIMRCSNEINPNQKPSYFGLKTIDFLKETNQKPKNTQKNKSAVEEKNSILNSPNENLNVIEDEKNTQTTSLSVKLEKFKENDNLSKKGTKLIKSNDQINAGEINSSQILKKNEVIKIKEQKNEKDSKKSRSGKVQYNFFNFDSHMKKVNEHLHDFQASSHKLICPNEISSKENPLEKEVIRSQNISNPNGEENNEEIRVPQKNNINEKVDIDKSDFNLQIPKNPQLNLKEKKNDSNLKEEQVPNISITSSIIEGKTKAKFPTILSQRLHQPRSINLCHDSHANIINYFCESRKIAVCEYCLGEYRKEDKNFVDIKDYISKYQETLTNLISLSNHIIENLTFENQALSSKEKLIASINNKFKDFIDSLESARELVISIIKKRFDNFDKNSQSHIAEISEDLIQKSNELRKAMISKKYLNMLNIIKIEDIKKKETILNDMDESLKIFLDEQLNSINNNIVIPHLDIVDSLRKLSIKFIMNEFPTSIPKPIASLNFDQICWNNDSKIYRHSFSDKLFSFSTNYSINKNFLAEIRINKLSNSKIASLGISNIGFEINYSMLGYDFGPHQIAIFPNKIIGDRGKIINSELEYNEGDIIYITVLHNEITFKVNCSKASFICKSCKPPYYICCTLYNKNDEVEIINLKEL